MAIGIAVTGLTTQQQQDLGNAADMIPGRVALGLTKAQWVERLTLLYYKNLLKDWKRQTRQQTLTAAKTASNAELELEITQIDTDFV